MKGRKDLPHLIFPATFLVAIYRGVNPRQPALSVAYEPPFLSHKLYPLTAQAPSPDQLRRLTNWANAIASVWVLRSNGHEHLRGFLAVPVIGLDGVVGELYGCKIGDVQASKTALK